jgi:hypothetical protein
MCYVYINIYEMLNIDRTVNFLNYTLYISSAKYKSIKNIKIPAREEDECEFYYLINYS